MQDDRGVELQQALQAVRDGDLPVRPGDLLLFHASGNRMLVISADSYRNQGGRACQRVGGLMSTTHMTCTITVMFLDWAGYSSHWTIHRIVL
jgi:hypothetical protein